MSSDGGKFRLVALKFLPSLFKKIFSAHPDHDEEKDTIHSVQAQEKTGHQAEGKTGHQAEAKLFLREEGKCDQSKEPYCQDSRCQNIEKQISIHWFQT